MERVPTQVSGFSVMLLYLPVTLEEVISIYSDSTDMNSWIAEDDIRQICDRKWPLRRRKYFSQRLESFRVAAVAEVYCVPFRDFSETQWHMWPKNNNYCNCRNHLCLLQKPTNPIHNSQTVSRGWVSCSRHKPCRLSWHDTSSGGQGDFTIHEEKYFPLASYKAFCA